MHAGLKRKVRAVFDEVSLCVGRGEVLYEFMCSCCMACAANDDDTRRHHECPQLILIRKDNAHRRSTGERLVGIVRREEEMRDALGELAKLDARAARVSVTGNREYNPGWHTCMDLANLMTVSEAVTRAAIERKESRGGQFRDDYPKKDSAKFGKVNTVVWKGPDGKMQFRWETIPQMPDDLKEVIKEQGEGKLPEELA